MALPVAATADPAILPDKSHLVTSLPRPGGDHKFTAARPATHRELMLVPVPSSVASFCSFPCCAFHLVPVGLPPGLIS